MIEDGFAERSEAGAHWLHLDGDQPVILTIIGSNFVNFWGHYIDRKMRICDGNNCRFCVAGVGRQRRYCFDVGLVDSGEQLLYETSETVADQIRDIISNNRTGNRIDFEVRRMSVSKHSNIVVKRVFSETNRRFEDYSPQKLKEILMDQEARFIRYDDLKRNNRQNQGNLGSFKDFNRRSAEL